MCDDQAQVTATAGNHHRQHASTDAAIENHAAMDESSTAGISFFFLGTRDLERCMNVACRRTGQDEANHVRNRKQSTCNICVGVSSSQLLMALM